jgi:hypothetical protein
MASQIIAHAANRVRGRGLSIKTNLPADGDICVSMNDESFTKIASTATHKVHFESVEQHQKPQKSEALLNDDWRHNRRPRRSDIVESLKSAPSWKEKFFAELPMPGLTEKMEEKKLRIDTSIGHIRGVRRCRDARDSPIDPDFILSAPATKKEFGLASYEEDIREDSDEDKEMTEVVAPGNDMLYLGPKHYVHLEWVKPIVDGISVERSPIDSVGNSPWSAGIASFTPVTSEGSEKSCVDVHFPMAEMQRIQNPAGLKHRDWLDIDEDIRRQFEKLGHPDGVEQAGSPAVSTSETEEQAKTAGKKAMLDDPAIQSMQLNGQQRKATSPYVYDRKKEKSGFTALLSKLQKASAHRLRSQDPAIVTLKPLDKLSNMAPKRRPSQDSGVSGVSGQSPLKARTLNPKATEFVVSAVPEQLPTTVPVGNQSRVNRPSVMGLFKDMPTATTLPGRSTADYLAFLGQRMSDMETHLCRLAELQAQAVDLQTHGFPHHLNQPPGFASPLDPGCLFPSNEIDAYLGLQAEEPAIRHLGVPPGLAPPSNLTPPILNNFGLPMHGLGSARVTPNSGYMPTSNVDAYNHPPPDFVGMHNATHNVLPPAYLPPVPSAPLAQKPMPGQLPPGPASTPIYMNSVFGPKPVRKPRGPFRPGDPVQAKQQQEYEAYLEWRRANDVTYAQQCKARQQKRAERQQSSLQKSDDSAPSMLSMHLAIQAVDVEKEKTKENVTIG